VSNYDAKRIIKLIKGLAKKGRAIAHIGLTGGIDMQFPSLTYKRHQAPAFGIAIPYLHDHTVAARFLEAVQLNSDDAWAFVSKICAQSLDLEALREVLGTGTSYTQVLTAAYIGESKNCMTRSICVEDPNRGMRRLLHLHMIKEPDQYGLWKIYCVE